MASLIAVGGVNAGADEGVSDIIACLEGDIDIGAVELIDVDSVVYAVFLGGVYEIGCQIVVVGAACVFGADGHLIFLAVESVAYTAHIDSDHIHDIRGDTCGSAVADLFIYGKVDIYLSAKLDISVVVRLSKGEKNG